MNELSVLLFLANNPALNTARDIVQLRALAKSHVCMSVDAVSYTHLEQERSIFL